MFRFFAAPPVADHAEGDLYKVIDLHGHSFPIHYGYYDEQERHNPLIEPIPIYPDFVSDPKFTPEGYRFVTKMQDACSHYHGPHKPDADCAECSHYRHGNDLLGICICEKTKQ